MQRSNNRRREYQRRQQRKRLTVIAAAAAVIIIAVVLIIALRPDGQDRPAITQATASPTPTVEASVSPSPTPTVTPVPTPELPYSANAKYRPYAEDGYLPIFSKANTSEMMIAITIDDCKEVENLRTIVQTAIDSGAKLTFFPIGSAAVKAEHSEVLKWAWENGMELENHTYNHHSLYNCTDDRLAKEIFVQNLALSKVVGMEYQGHFLRPAVTQAQNDQRIHAYAEQMGYYGIAHWSVSGSETKMNDLPSVLQPGGIYQFNTTDEDLAKLVKFIPYAVSKGYRVVTLNEMFGYPENETKPLTKAFKDYTVPALEPYDVKHVTYRETTYAYGVMEIQEQLIALGYLEGEPDGAYGPGCAAAVMRFQKDNGLPVNGEADEITQQKLKEAYAASLGAGV